MSWTHPLPSFMAALGSTTKEHADIRLRNNTTVQQRLNSAKMADKTETPTT
jgi:hypothetical protein